MDDLELTYKKIKNYLKKQIGNSNETKIRNQLLCLFFSNINTIPIAKEITDDEYKIAIANFPHYFTEVNKKKIIEIFNKDVCPKKPLQINHDFTYNYDIKEGGHLVISPKTLRPLYYNDWKEQAENLNGIKLTYQLSFYADYLRYYFKFKKFPDFDEFLLYIYYKYKKPVHKDIINVFTNISNSYDSVLLQIKNANLSYSDIKKILIKSAPISNRILIQNKTDE